MYLFGASGHGKVIKDILHANGIKVKAFVDDNTEINECAGCPVLHDVTGLSPMIVSIGVNRVRKVIVGKLVTNNKDIEFVTIIHPSAIMSPSAKIGEGSVDGWCCDQCGCSDWQALHCQYRRYYRS